VITEPDVTLTDWGLAVESAILARLIAGVGGPVPTRAWLVLFFASTALAALTGGAVHGLFLDPTSAGQRVLWPVTLLAIGATASAAWAAGGYVARVGRAIVTGAGIAFVAYAVIA
jgi:hypothetical protein